MERRVAILDPHKVNAGVTVIVSMKTDQHSLAWLERFHAAVADFPEVVEFYRMSGEVDYLLRVVVPDIEAYDVFYKRLIARIEIAEVSSAFAMEQIKYTTALPLHFAREDGAERASRLRPQGLDQRGERRQREAISAAMPIAVNVSGIPHTLYLRICGVCDSP